MPCLNYLNISSASYIAGSALDKDSSQELGFLDWLLQGQKSSSPCLRVHAQREPAESSERLFILASFFNTSSWL
uniref:Uncharacterized protein n=1 Tax=Aegilops tauschii subsp. strangulata TaxID=200361 RepID=A0A453NCI8_AEGTS